MIFINDAIVLKKFCWRYPSFTEKPSNFALKNINLVVKANETLGILGRNGSGKSTLCSAIAGIIPYQAHLTEQEGPKFMRGSVTVFGKIVSSATKDSAKKGFTCDGVASPTVGLVMQDPESQFLTTSIREELYLGLKFMSLPSRIADIRVKRALETVGLINLYPYIEEIHPSELSGGQKQRLIIASFIAMMPKILILDEPTSDLDPLGKFEVIDAIKKIKEKLKITLIITEQDPDVIYRIADKAIVLANGKIKTSGTPFTVYSNRLLCKKLSIARPELFDIADAAHVAPTNSVNLLAKRIEQSAIRMGQKKRITKTGSSKLILDAKEVQFTYKDGVVAINHASLQIREREFVALIGQNGSGKTTLAQVLSGMEVPSAGKITVAGLDLMVGKERRMVHKHVGYIFQNPDNQLFTRSVYDEVDYGLSANGFSKAIREKRIRGLLKEVGLMHKSREDPIFLSRSEKRKLALISILALSPKVIIADELLMGQDQKTSTQIMGLLKKYNDTGGSVVLITHDMRLAAQYCSRALVMKNGKVVYDGPTDKFFSNKTLLRDVSLKAPKSILLSENLRQRGLINQPMMSVDAISKLF